MREDARHRHVISELTEQLQMPGNNIEGFEAAVNDLQNEKETLFRQVETAAKEAEAAAKQQKEASEKLAYEYVSCVSTKTSSPELPICWHNLH